MNIRLKGFIVLHYGTQADFAQAIDESCETVSKVIRGRKKLSKEKQKKWADVLNAQPVFLFGDENKIKE